jgi:hypothetical protein
MMLSTYTVSAESAKHFSIKWQNDQLLAENVTGFGSNIVGVFGMVFSRSGSDDWKESGQMYQARAHCS